MSRIVAVAVRGPGLSLPGATLVFAGLALGAVALAFGVVHWSWLASGALFGAILLAVVIFEPLALVAFMLAVGPVDLSFMTGGFKALFPAAGGLDMNGIRLVGVTAGFIVLAMANRSIQRVAVGPHGRWYLLFLIWGTASLALTLSSVEGLRLLLKLAYPFLTFLVVAGMVEREEQLDRLLTWTILVGALIVIVINPLFVLGGAYTVDPQGFRRVRGMGAHENPFSFYLLVLMLIAFARFAIRRQWRYLLLCGLAGFWIALTRTRITVIGVFAGLVAIMVYNALAARKQRSVLAGAVVALLLGSILVPVALERSLGYVPTPRELADLVRSPTRLYEVINWQGRQVLWPIVYNEFRAQPITGLGLGSSTMVLRENFPTYVTEVVHNEYLRLATDTGLIGVGLYFLAIASWIAGVLRVGWRAGPEVREYALPALGVMAAWVFIALTDNAFDYYAPFTQYAGFLSGGALAAARLARQRADAELAPGE